jgi:hypothetical protein
MKLLAPLLDLFAMDEGDGSMIVFAPFIAAVWFAMRVIIEIVVSDPNAWGNLMHWIGR